MTAFFKPRNKCFPPNYNRGLKIGINTLKFKETTKYLGLLLDSKLTWENHIQELNKKMVKYTGIFSKVRHYLPITCHKTVYNAFIFSRLNYGSEIYINTAKKYISPLILTQNKLLRILQFKNIRTPLKDLYREFNTLKLKDLHHYNLCCIVHKFIHTPDLLPEAMNELFCRNEQIHNYNTRQSKGFASSKNKFHKINVGG